MKNNKGFTLIEILAVIVILGLIIAIAIPAVSYYIDNSRRNVYIDDANEYITIASQMIAKNDFVIRSTDTVYYIHIGNLLTEKNNNSSPWGKWLDAYVVVVIEEDTNDFEYYWISVDETGHRVDLTKQSDLSVDDIYVSTNLTISASFPVGARDNIVVYDSDGNRNESVSASVDLTLEEAEACYSWTESGGELTITGYDVSCGTDINLPSTIDGKRVTAIGYGAFKNMGITSVYFYSGITSIGYGAFQGNNISTVKLSQYVTTISDYAFYNSNISTLIMQEGVQTIGSYSFAKNNICSVEFPSTLSSIGTYAFYDNCLTGINLSNNTTSIGGGAFSNNNISYANAFIYKKTSSGYDYSTIIGYAGDSVSDLEIPATKNGIALKTIGTYAFANAGLTGSITIPETVTTIESYAFYYNSLTSIVYSGTSQLTTIGTRAFGSNYLTEANIPDTVTSLGSYTFTLNDMTGDDAFIYARTSSGIDYSTIVSYGGGRNVSSRTVVIPASMNGVTLKKIKSYAFSDCNITSITFPDLSETPNLTIENNAFARNNVSGSAGFIYKMKNGAWDYSILSSYAGPSKGVNGTVTIPESYNGVTLTSIQASFSWRSYSKIIIPSGVESISSSVFSKNARNNQNFKTIVNLTGRSFDWQLITGSSYSATFVTGTIEHEAGNIIVTDTE